MAGLAFETGQLADWSNSKKNIFFSSMKSVFIFVIYIYIYIATQKEKTIKLASIHLSKRK
jgi:hypothetical protein